MSTFQDVCGELVSVDQSTVSRTVSRVSDAMFRQAQQHIFFPDQACANRTKRALYQIPQRGGVHRWNVRAHPATTRAGAWIRQLKRIPFNQHSGRTLCHHPIPPNTLCVLVCVCVCVCASVCVCTHVCASVCVCAHTCMCVCVCVCDVCVTVCSCMCVRACVCVWYLDRKCEYELIIDFIRFQRRSRMHWAIAAQWKCNATTSHGWKFSSLNVMVFCQWSLAGLVECRILCLKRKPEGLAMHCHFHRGDWSFPLTNEKIRFHAGFPSNL